MKFEIYNGGGSGLLGITPGGQIGWRWRLKGSNGEPIASGESYPAKADCLHAIKLVQQTNHMTPIVEVAG